MELISEKEMDPNRPNFDPDEIIHDYKLAVMSRQVSLIGRREVLSGKAKFGIFGDGKELPQIIMAKFFRHGDFRSGYYRDQTLIFALGIATIQEFFAQLYAHADVEHDPATAGRAMNAHFANRLLNDDGSWKNQTEMYNSSADISPTASQMPRLVGLGYASRLYRELEELDSFDTFSSNGDEVAFGTIGNASCAEGVFWESINAAGVLKAPVVVSIWDDGYGISVPNEYQMVKQDIGALLEGFQRDDEGNGFDIYVVKAWDYPALMDTYRQAVENARCDHIPAIVHVVEVTQPQGHSTSGSHERYKTPERLAWEQEYDCNRKMREWIVDRGFASEETLDQIEKESRAEVEAIRVKAWEAYLEPIRQDVRSVADILEINCSSLNKTKELERVRSKLVAIRQPYHRDITAAIRDALIILKEEDHPCKKQLIQWKGNIEADGRERYSTHLHSQSSHSALNVPAVKADYEQDAPLVSGFQLLNKCFESMLNRDPRFIAFGEDVGYLGDVNQGFAGLQAEFGQLRVSDTGIREATIIGQAIGMAIRGLRPMAEIQYLDYLLYALQILSDDLSTLHWRTMGGQKAPVIIRTRGHRLEGIWHSGSPMAAVIHLLRGIHVLVPRNMTQAAGFYNTLLLSDEPGLVVEVLNGYRMKEKLPNNIGSFTVPLGIPEIIRPGEHVTLVTYGATCRVALQAAILLQKVGVDLEIIDVQSLLPFDVHGLIVDSLKKTGRIVFVDEDVPGGTTAYMMQEVLEQQGGFWDLDSEPRTLTGQAHRPAFGSDGDHWSVPNIDQIFEVVYEIMNEADPATFPIFYR